MIRTFFRLMMAASKRRLTRYTGHILLETGDVLAAEDGSQLTAEGN